jgi:microcystin-dependent protein
MGERFLGEIKEFAGLSTPAETAPAGWALCDGQLLAVDSYPGLFALIGTEYGGDGTHSFAVPALAGGSSRFIIALDH